MTKDWFGPHITPVKVIENYLMNIEKFEENLPLIYSHPRYENVSVMTKS
jgi:hypothetical protein